MENKFMKRYKEQFESPSPNGLLYFLVGLIIAGIGTFIIFQNTQISTRFTLSDFIGFTPPFGIILLPLLLGIGVLFFNEKSIIGWFLVIFGILTILAGLLMGLQVYFRPVTLYQGILMFGMVTAGIGLMLKGLFDKKRSN